MADIFLSYAREDEARARLAAAALESHGWSVWWDRRIPHGKDFNAYIEQQLEAARCIVVLWSKASIASRFVRDEATEGLSDGRLVPALVEAVRQPLGFRQLHAANLSDWDGRSAHDDFDRLVESIRSVVPPSVTRSSIAPTPPPGPQASAQQASVRLESSPVAKSRTEPASVAATRNDPRARTILGIDLGTTNAIASVWRNGRPALITNSQGGRSIASVVAFPKTGDPVVGDVAKRATNPENTIVAINRLMGRAYDEVTEETRMMPYKIVRGPKGDARVTANGKEYSPPEISAMILQTLKQIASAYLGVSIGDAVIAVPAHFNDAQRQATKHAGEIAGLNVVRIVNAPTAAALAYSAGVAKDETIAVYDFGGGTFDISILKVDEGVVEVRAATGDSHLGGLDLDQKIIDWVIGEFKETHRIDLAQDWMALQRIREAAEKAKIELATLQETDLNLPFITADQSGPKHLVMKLTRAKFEQLVEALLQKTVELSRQALADAGEDPSEIDSVLLIGGSTRIPRVQAIVKELFGKASHERPDDAVALGAAIQAALLSGDATDSICLDVTPLSLGLETLGGVMTTLVPRNSTIPTRKTEIFSTASDNQTSVEIHVLQGERPLARDNWTLGRFHLPGIPRAPRGVPQIEVTFDIDANGIVSVQAKDLGTGKEQKITTTASIGLTKDEIQRLTNEAVARARSSSVGHER